MKKCCESFFFSKESAKFVFFPVKKPSGRAGLDARRNQKVCTFFSSSAAFEPQSPPGSEMQLLRYPFNQNCTSK